MIKFERDPYSKNSFYYIHYNKQLLYLKCEIIDNKLLCPEKYSIITKLNDQIKSFLKNNNITLKLIITNTGHKHVILHLDKFKIENNICTLHVKIKHEF